ncbi:TetR/AcrR family transcriptional regulator [Opitutus terrae]|uniref:Transcriptional regulator, TetR family n=1 Tax=Opitutus terrae (strain DSM 11246 / JCM 15787 / PB90-1) TaxID=452637 RepID=B1ZUL1_OPITP|nr:TetR/AcrR family transcriptional regulator [Opitutus terrae]ACB74054.1 transcriptional regulator, TetR family [Opitutus terrae PB90-1]
MSSTASPAPASTPKRDRLLDVANRLFYRQGYHATGIDTILAEAELAKMTLYHHFASKEELIVAALERRSQAIGGALAAAMQAAGSSPRKRLQALFDWHAEWFADRQFNGCAFMRAVGEYPELKSPVHQAVRKHKQASRARLEQLLSEMKLPGAAALAQQIQLLLEGAIAIAHTEGDPASIEAARTAAFELIKAAER